MNRGFVLALIIMALLAFLVAWSARADERYVLSGHVEGTEWFDSEEKKPSSAAFVVGIASDPLPSWRGARLEVEGQVMRHWQGLAIGLRKDLGEHWLIAAGTGVGRLNADLDWQSDGLNFLLQGGLGYRWRGWRADVRLHHISNARLRQPNTGTNGILVLIGRTW